MALGTEEVCLCMNIALGYFRGLRVSTAMLHTMFKVSYHDLVESFKSNSDNAQSPIAHIFRPLYSANPKHTHTQTHTLSNTWDQEHPFECSPCQKESLRWFKSSTVSISATLRFR